MMEVGLLGYILEKVRKIEVYERGPISDEEYTARKLKRYGKLKTARKNYRLTHEKKYKNEIERIKNSLRYLISKTEYELCKKTIEDFKASYCHIIAEKYWNYDDLLGIYNRVKADGCEYVEQARTRKVRKAKLI